MTNKKLSLEIVIPTYNGAKTIKDTLRSILSQSFKDYKIIVHDDCSTDNTEEIVKSLKDPRISFFKNEKNLSCQKNIEAGRLKAKADIVYFMCQDDILADNALLETYEVFVNNPEIGVVSRPYYWFDKDINTPVRAISQMNDKKNEIITINDSYDRIKLFIDSLCQLSGLAYRRSFFNTPVHEDIFPGHVYPFVGILKKHPVVFLKDYNVAVRISSSQSRTVSSIYNKSPVLSWVEFYQNLFPEKKFDTFREYFIKEHVAVNYLGLIQIKNYSTFKNVLREIYMLIKYRPLNLLNPFFILVSLGVIILPPFILIPFVDWYKNTILSKVLPKINFLYTLSK